MPHNKRAYSNVLGIRCDKVGSPVFGKLGRNTTLVAIGRFAWIGAGNLDRAIRGDGNGGACGKVEAGIGPERFGHAVKRG